MPAKSKENERVKGLAKNLFMEQNEKLDLIFITEKCMLHLRQTAFTKSKEKVYFDQIPPAFPFWIWTNIEGGCYGVPRRCVLLDFVWLPPRPLNVAVERVFFTPTLRC